MKEVNFRAAVEEFYLYLQTCNFGYCNLVNILLLKIGSLPFVSVQWKDLENMGSVADVNEYPAVWLRDNCQCPSCYNKYANARLLLMKNLDVDVKPERVSVEDNQVRSSKISTNYLIWCIAQLFRLLDIITIYIMLRI